MASWQMHTAGCSTMKTSSAGAMPGMANCAWVKGDPGKGKTMLLCGIINTLGPSTRLIDPAAGTLLSYFFCQATDSRINSSCAVLRGLIYMLVQQQRTLISHIRKRYDQVGNSFSRT